MKRLLFVTAVVMSWSGLLIVLSYQPDTSVLGLIGITIVGSIGGGALALMLMMLTPDRNFDRDE